MKIHQQDRRSRRSRRLLGDALLVLLQEQDLSKIKVRQVTDYADVGYMTFYRHYANLDDLLVDRTRMLIEDEITHVIADCDRQSLYIFTHVTKHLSLYRAIVFSDGAVRARHKLEQLLSEFFILTVMDDPLIPSALRARKMASSVITLIQWWLENNMATSIDTMASLYNRLILDDNIDMEKMRALSAQNTALNASICIGG